MDVASIEYFGSMFIDETTNIGIQMERHDYRAHAALQAGDIDTACRELVATQWRLPLDLDNVIEWVRVLRVHNRQKEADAIIEGVHGRLMNAAQRLSKSAACHDSLAWFDACCDVHLNEALEQAKTADTLWPNNATFIDTLAEVYGHLGQRAKALELLQKCIDLEPAVNLHRDRLKQWQSKPAPMP